MKGSERIAEILIGEYGRKSLAGWEDIDYTIEHFTDKISRVKITSRSGEKFCCPVYALFDGYHMSWYGDYGSFVFCCTWETNVMNLAYESPYYQLEKLNSKDREEWDEYDCKEKFLKLLREGDWYQYTLTDEQRARFDEFIKTDYDFIDYEDELFEHKDLCDDLIALYSNAADYIEWIAALRHTSLSDEDIYNVFNVEPYELYDIGKKPPMQYFIILYMLSVVANTERERKEADEQR